MNCTGKLAWQATSPLPWVFPAKEKLPIHPSLSSPVQKLCLNAQKSIFSNSHVSDYHFQPSQTAAMNLYPPPSLLPLVLPLPHSSFPFIALYSKAPLLIPSKAQTKNLSRCHLLRRAIYHLGAGGGSLAASQRQRGGAGTGGRVKDFHAQQKTCHNYLWL